MHRKHSVPAMLLLTALIYGCDGTAPGGPAAPEQVLFSQSGSKAYTYTHAGDLTTDPETGNGGPNVGKKGSQEVVMGSSRKGEDLVLTTIRARLASGTACFPTAVKFAGVLSLGNNNAVTGTYYFDGFASDGTTAIKYVLKINGTVTSGSFPPSPGATAVVTWNGAGAATMGTEGRSKGACTGTLAAHGGVSVTGGN